MGSWISKGVSLDDWRTNTKLSYTWYWVLACIPFLSLEQLYLGSPKTFLLKSVLNLFLMGYPYFYEMFMATWARPQIELFGSPNPLTYSLAVGGGRFAKPEEPVSQAHASAFWYPFILFIFGIVGGDSFLMGNFTSGFFRLFCTMSGFLFPISFIWWAYKLLLYVFVTDSVYADNGAYFGYPPAKEGDCPSTLEQLTGWVFAVAKAVTAPFPIIGPAVATMADTFEASVGFAVTFFGFIVDQAKATATGAVEVAETVGTTKLGGIQEKKEEIEEAAAAQKGGGSPALDTSSALGALLTGTLFFIFVSSIVLSWRRTYQNATSSKSTNTTNTTKTKTDATTATTIERPGEGDDVPPEPRGARATSQGA
jgi:hypothetical protein